MKKFNKIEDLFIEELEGFAPTLNAGEIESMDKLFIKKNFYKFNPYQFNVFYAAAVLTSIIINTVFIYHYFYEQHTVVRTVYVHNTAVEKNSVAGKQENTVRSTNSVASTKPVHTALDKKGAATGSLLLPSATKDNNKLIHKDLINPGPESSKSVSIASEETDSPTPKDVIAKEQNIEIAKTIIKLKPEKKIVYISRKDTIFELDTVKAGRRRRK